MERRPPGGQDWRLLSICELSEQELDHSPGVVEQLEFADNGCRTLLFSSVDPCEGRNVPMKTNHLPG